MSEIRQIPMPLIKNSFRELGRAVREALPASRRVMIAGDSHTVPLYAEEAASSFRDFFPEVYCYTFPAGEAYKQLSTVEDLLIRLMELHFDRKDVIVALGGGVVGDMAGFAAAIYLRGISVVQAPTTLLSQVDSSIGGKTGVDLHGFKNMVGAFHLPRLIFTNPSVLSTLPGEQFAAGMGEVIKTALLADRDLWDWLTAEREAVLAGQEEALLYMIQKAAGIKTAIVMRDPTEQNERALLNLGHTIGHAIEKSCHFSRLHGECVAVGTVAAAAISLQRHLISEADYEAVKDMCRCYHLPVSVDITDPKAILMLTKSDKKMSGGRIRFVLFDAIGHAFWTDDVTDEEILHGIRAVTA